MSVMKDNDIKIILADLYSDCFEVSDTVDVNSLPQAGGDRRYFRISGVAGSCVGTYDPDVAESRCFISLAKALRGEGRRCHACWILVPIPAFIFKRISATVPFFLYCPILMRFL